MRWFYPGRVVRSRFRWAPVIPTAFAITMAYPAVIVAWMVPDLWLGVAATWALVAAPGFAISYVLDRREYQRQLDEESTRIFRP